MKIRTHSHHYLEKHFKHLLPSRWHQTLLSSWCQHFITFFGGYFCLLVFLFLKIFIKEFLKIIVNAYAIVKKKICREVLCSSPVSPNGNIVQNYRVISQPGNWHLYNPSTSFRFSGFIRTHLCVCVLFLYWSVTIVPFSIIIVFGWVRHSREIVAPPE